jgi:hypothetical protein
VREKEIVVVIAADRESSYILSLCARVVCFCARFLTKSFEAQIGKKKSSHFFPKK